MILHYREVEDLLHGDDPMHERAEHSISSLSTPDPCMNDSVTQPQPALSENENLQTLAGLTSCSITVSTIRLISSFRLPRSVPYSSSSCRLTLLLVRNSRSASAQIRTIEACRAAVEIDKGSGLDGPRASRPNPDDARRNGSWV